MTTTRPRLLALGFAGLGVTAALSACTTPGTGGGEAGINPDADTSAEYTDGTYEALGQYVSPAGPSEVTVELTLENDIVTDVVVTPHATEGNSVRFQGQFVEGIAAIVVGKDIDTLAVSRVGGSSLTSGGFADAIADIKAEAIV
jgi:uncharacterized protein with FMN-binding domain